MPLLTDTPLAYDRGSVTPGILHFGVGQFCRGHLFYYTHKLLEKTAAQQRAAGKNGANDKAPKLDFGIIGVNVMKGDREREMWLDFKKQQCLYSLTLFPHDSAPGSGQAAPQTVVVGSMLDYIYAPEELDRLLDILIDPRIRIVSLTVTEGGYNINENTGEFDLSNPAVRADLSHPRRPQTTFGIIVEGLRRRRETHRSTASRGAVLPFTVMSCDNLRHNGDVARKAILGYAKAVDKSLATWIERNVSFPNSMVDRITPTTTKEVKQMLQSLPGGIANDEQPVIAEAFGQWVVEDKFVHGVRPAWETVGLQLTNNVAGFEHTKIRVLNSSHLMLTFSGLLLGYRTVHEALADPDIRHLVERALDQDVLPLLTSPMDKVKYKETILARFSNAAIADQLLRIAGDGTSKVQVFWANNIIAVLARAEAAATERKGKTTKSTKKAAVVNAYPAESLDNFAFGLACFLLYLKGKDCKGEVFPVIEPKLAPETWKSVMQPAGLEPTPPRYNGNAEKAMLSFNAFDPWRNRPGRAQLEKRMLLHYAEMQKKGVREALRQLTKGGSAPPTQAKL